MLSLRSHGTVERHTGRRRRIDRSLLAVSLMIAVGLLLIIWGVATSVTGDDAAGYPDEIEEVSPTPNAAQVPHQAQIFIDLESGYEARLFVDGAEIVVATRGEIAATDDPAPGEQVSLPPAAIYERGNATVTFTPSDGAPIEELSTGTHDVKIIYWRTADGPDTARSFTWKFDVV